MKLSKRTESKINQYDLNNLPFGKVFTDHMFVMNYRDGQWHEGEIKPYESLALSPATMALHYGQAIFEGMKAELGPEGDVLMFRPELNARRFNRSADRLCMPAVPEETYIGAIKELVKIDRSWIPTSEGSSLYIRPFMFASSPYIGVKESEEYQFIIFCCPVGPYYSAPVNVFIEDTYARACQGGTGFAKAAGNYAGSLYPARLAKELGYDQILWTDAKNHEYVQEIGTMNVFFVIDGKYITPATNDNILEGTTRQTVIELLKAEGIEVEQRAVSVKELMEAFDAGKLDDAWGTGTAAAIIPIASLGNRELKMELKEVSERKHWQTLKENLISYKRGLQKDIYNWLVRC